MSALCAACHQPITAGRFKIDREFAFHPACVGLPIRIETELAVARSAAATAGATITDITQRRADLRQKTENDARIAKLAHDSTKSELATTRADLATSQTIIRALEAELAALRAERNAPTAPATADPRDDATVRFGLLELK